jgi:hypothetical protein
MSQCQATPSRARVTVRRALLYSHNEPSSRPSRLFALSAGINGALAIQDCYDCPVRAPVALDSREGTRRARRLFISNYSTVLRALYVSSRFAGINGALTTQGRYDCLSGQIVARYSRKGREGTRRAPSLLLSFLKGRKRSARTSCDDRDDLNDF